MKELDLLKTIGYAQDDYILDANTEPQKAKKKPRFRLLAAVLALVLALTIFLQTPVGAAAMEMVKQQISQFLNTLFPPKEIDVYLEGNAVKVHHEAQGREPEVSTPGFAIYVDTENYTMAEENGGWFIRPKEVPLPSREEIRQDQKAIIQNMTPEEQEAAIDRRLEELQTFYASLPPCEMEIRELPELDPETAAVMTRATMEGQWENLSETWNYSQPMIWRFSAQQGTNWNSACEDHYFLDNSRGGCFHIIARYYLEATEGHFARFVAMLDTFTVVAPQDTSQYTSPADTLLQAMHQEVAYAEQREMELLDAVQNAMNQTDMNIAAYEYSALWQEVHQKLWGALEQALDAETMADLMAEQLNWAAGKKAELDALRVEMDGGTLTGTVVESRDVTLTKDRVMVLLSYLDGTAAPVQRPEGLVLSPEQTVNAFADAYFRRDIPGMKSYLSAVFSGSVDCFAAGSEVIHAIKNCENVADTMTRWGQLTPSVEFQMTPESDSYTYLSMELIWENDHWAVASYGLEG